MEPEALLFLLLVLACPLMMVWMMRGHGGHASHGAVHRHAHHPAGELPSERSLQELRRRRAELDAEIEVLEQSEAETKTPGAV